MTARKARFEVGATYAVMKRLEKDVAPGVRAAFGGLVDRLRADPRFVAPDKRTIWGKAWPDVPNHRHDDLPGAWRVAWTIRAEDGEEKVTVLFLGTHKEYEKLYGFRKQ